MSTETTPELVEIQDVEGVTVVRFLRRTILDPLAIEALGERLQGLVRDQNCNRLAIDCSKVESLTSSMLGKFASLHVAVSRAGDCSTRVPCSACARLSCTSASELADAQSCK